MGIISSEYGTCSYWTTRVMSNVLLHNHEDGDGHHIHPAKDISRVVLHNHIKLTIHKLHQDMEILC